MPHSLDTYLNELQQFATNEHIHHEVKKTAVEMIAQIGALTPETVDTFMKQFRTTVMRKKIKFLYFNEDYIRPPRLGIIGGKEETVPSDNIDKQLKLYENAQLGDRSFILLVSDILFALGRSYPANKRNANGELISPISGTPIVTKTHFVDLARYHYASDELELSRCEHTYEPVMLHGQPTNTWVKICDLEKKQLISIQGYDEEKLLNKERADQEACRAAHAARAREPIDMPTQIRFRAIDLGIDYTDRTERRIPSVTTVSIFPTPPSTDAPNAQPTSDAHGARKS